MSSVRNGRIVVTAQGGPEVFKYIEDNVATSAPSGPGIEPKDKYFFKMGIRLDIAMFRKYKDAYQIAVSINWVPLSSRFIFLISRGLIRKYGRPRRRKYPGPSSSQGRDASSSKTARSSKAGGQSQRERGAAGSHAAPGDLGHDLRLSRH